MEFLIKQQSDNHFELSRKEDSRAILYGNWSMLFGKYKAEILDSNEKQLFTIKRKFSLWKWNMSYLIQDEQGKSFVLTAKNKWHSIYAMQLDYDEYQLKIHRGRKKSIFKNGQQIAKIDESPVEIFYRDTISVITNDPKSIREIFLMIVCLKIEDVNEGGLTFDLGNIGKMEPIDKNWRAEKTINN